MTTESSIAPATLQVHIELHISEIVRKYPNPEANQVILLTPEFYNVKPYNKEGKFIPLPLKTKILRLELSSVAFGNHRLWLTYFHDLTLGRLVPSQSNASNQPHIMDLSIPELKMGEKETFTLHCYFLYYNPGERVNRVYHCRIDPQLRVQEE